MRVCIIAFPIFQLCVQSIRFAGFASWTQNCGTQTDYLQDSLMQVACKTAYGSDMRSATHDELLKMELENDSNMYLVGTCGSSDTCYGSNSYSQNLNGHARNCFDNRQITTFVNINPTCCTNNRSTACVFATLPPTARPSNSNFPTAPCIDLYDYCSAVALNGNCYTKDWDSRMEIQSHCPLSCETCWNATVVPTSAPTPTPKPRDCADNIGYCNIIRTSCTSSDADTLLRMISECSLTCGFCTLTPTSTPTKVDPTDSPTSLSAGSPKDTQILPSFAPTLNLSGFTNKGGKTKSSDYENYVIYLLAAVCLLLCSFIIYSRTVKKDIKRLGIQIVEMHSNIHRASAENTAAVMEYGEYEGSFTPVDPDI
jgi:hypothetical protein